MRGFLVLAASAAVAYAACPNQCSGHGACGGADQCDCFANWMGPDCSQRVCEYGNAWAIDDVNPHAYAECSAQGTCNRATGECECFDGFTGRACARSSCPNDCSGHGVCRLLSEMQQSVDYDASNWDATRIQACDCDQGFYGPDCSMRYCPSGDDPLTFCKNANTAATKHVQQVRVTIGSEDLTTATTEGMSLFGTSSSQTSENVAGADGQMLVHYYTPYGDKYTTIGVKDIFGGDNDNAKNSIKTALETLPNKVVNSVTVESDTTTGAISGLKQRLYQVTFTPDLTNSINMGLMNTMKCDAAYTCTEPGCQPFVKMPYLYRYAFVPSAAVTTSANSAQSTITVSGITFKTGSGNDWTSPTSAFIKLHADSQPQLPAGVVVDSAFANTAIGKRRYDMRVLVIVEDNNDGVDNTADNYYVRVVVGHANITSTKDMIFGLRGPFTKSIEASGGSPWSGWASPPATLTAELDGFTFMGPIPANMDKVPVPGAPGVYLSFPKSNMVGNGQRTISEILLKMPSCTVTPFNRANAFTAISGTTPPTVIDPQIENIECSGRGMCNRQTGECGCFEGYYGIACHKQTTLL